MGAFVADVGYLVWLTFDPQAGMSKRVGAQF